jgi:hypothetical protein
MVSLERNVSRTVDCLLESKNNVHRREWDLAATNLRKLFRNATAIQNQRPTVLRQLRLARKDKP